jgi:hypothetical protein
VIDAPLDFGFALGKAGIKRKTNTSFGKDNTLFYNNDRLSILCQI